jgi:ketopantoate reductase
LQIKATALSACVDQLKPLLGKHTAVVTAMNGLAYW